MLFTSAFVFCLVLQLTTLSDARFNQSNFKNWVERNRRHYSSQIEHQARLSIFLQNTQRVQQHNEAYEKGMTSYAMTIDSPFADLTDDEFKTAYLMDSQECSATHESSGTLTTKSSLRIPKSIDWRSKGVITPVKNQGSCGSCWTFSTTGALEAHHCIHSNLQEDCTTWAGLSEQQIVDCASAFDNNGCNGGLPSHAFEYIKYAGGLHTEQDYPYTANDTGGCEVLSSPRQQHEKEFVVQVAEVFNITSRDEVDLTAAIAKIGPVSVAFQVTPDFRFYSHGVYDSFNSTSNTVICQDDEQSVNHAVVAVGFGETVDAEPVPFYIIRNSWGSSWGMEGYFWMKRGQNLCGISDCASFPIVSVQNKISPI